ncbi:MAG: hypothetical protein ACFNS5_10885, partial [Prevotella melaninogenica]
VGSAAYGKIIFNKLKSLIAYAFNVFDILDIFKFSPSVGYCFISPKVVMPFTIVGKTGVIKAYKSCDSRTSQTGR